MKNISKHVILCLTFIIYSTYTKPPGLPQIGNNCYNNAVLQNIYNLPEIRNALIETKINTDQEPFLSTLKNTLGAMKEGRVTSEIATLIHKAGCHNLSHPLEKWKPGEQQDAREFFEAVINKIQEHQRLQPRLNAVLSSLGTSIMCPFYKSITQQQEVYLLAEVPENHIQLKNILSMQIDIEYSKDPYGPLLCKKQQYFAQPKKYACIILEKFKTKVKSQNPYRTKEIKTTTQVTVPDIIDIPIDAQKATKRYELIGVVVHRGQSTAGGHYVAYIKDQYEQHNPWYLCNDSRITKPTPEERKREIDLNGYMLFYKKANLQQKPESPKQSTSIQKKEKAQESDPALNNLASALHKIALNN